MDLLGDKLVEIEYEMRGPLSQRNEGYLFGSLHKKDYTIIGSILRLPYPDPLAEAKTVCAGQLRLLAFEKTLKRQEPSMDHCTY